MQSKWNTPNYYYHFHLFSVVLSRPNTMFPVVIYMARPATDLAYECVFQGKRQGLLQVWKLSLLFTSLCGLTHDVLLNWNRLRSCWVKNDPNFPQSLTVTFSVSYDFLWQGKWYSVTSLTKHWFKLDTRVLFLSPNPPSPHTHSSIQSYCFFHCPITLCWLAGWTTHLCHCCPAVIQRSDRWLWKGTPSVWPKTSWQLTTTKYYNSKGTILRLLTSFIVNICKTSHECDVYAPLPRHE